MKDRTKLDQRLSLAVSSKLNDDIKAAAKRDSRSPSSWARRALEIAAESALKRKSAPR